MLGATALARFARLSVLGATALARFAGLSVLGATALVAPAHAQNTVEGAFLYYADTDNVTVVSPTIAAQYARGPVRAGVRLAVDVISAASVDLVTAASPTGFDEERREGELNAGYELARGRWVEASWATSIEPDFVTQRGGLSFSEEVLDRRLTLSLAYAHSASEFGRTLDDSLNLERSGDALDLGASGVLSGRLVLDWLYGVDLTEGALENPYRMVRLFSPGADSHHTAVGEAVPQRRIHQTMTVRLRARPATSLYTQGTYRLFVDTWGVLAHTVLVRATRGFFGELVLLSVEGRGHLQDAAGFYRARYETFPEAPRLRTADKELGPLYTARGGLHVEYSPNVRFAEALRFGLGADLLYMRYLDYAYLDARTARLLVADLTWEL